MKKDQVALEPSTNTHFLEAQKVEKEDISEGCLKMKVQGEGVVSHGEHGSLKTESENVVKINQTEYNPVTRSLQQAYD